MRASMMLVVAAGASLLTLSSLAGCGQGAASAVSPEPSGGMGAGPSIEKSAESGRVDRVGAVDGALAPDGTPDVAFVCNVEGPADAFFLAAVDDKGAPTGKYQADTLSGEEEAPPELHSIKGKTTAGIGIATGEKLLNAPDGSVKLGPGPHRLVLYVTPNPSLTTGTRVRIYVRRPDKTLAAGGTVAN